MATSVPTLTIAGLSGAGKSSTVQLLENMGYFCVDSIPPNAALTLLEDLRSHYKRVALGLELSRASFVSDFKMASERWSDLPLLYLEAADTVLVRRFSANRRRHPLATDVDGLLAAIQFERDLLAPVRERSTFVIDTSSLSLRQMQLRLEELLLQAKRPPLTVSLVSFGFKHGIPVDANLVFDVRFLPNPYYIPELKPLTGQSPALQEYIFADAIAQQTYSRIRDMALEFLPLYLEERRTHVTIAVGCTGGQHRSVALIERLARDLAAALGDSRAYDLQTIHRHVADSLAEMQVSSSQPSGAGVAARV
ncbi:MAG: RNase adapter RapZ [Cyanobacteria bacterium J06642_2]